MIHMGYEFGWVLCGSYWFAFCFLRCAFYPFCIALALPCCFQSLIPSWFVLFVPRGKIKDRMA